MINIFFKTDPETAKQLDRMETLLRGINERTKTMSLDFSELRAAIDALKADVTRIAADLETNAGDQDAVKGFAAELRGVISTLDAADPVPAPEPVPSPEPAEQPVV